MWNDGAFPQLSSPRSSSCVRAGNSEWLQSSNTSAELERLNRDNFFSSLQDNYSDCLQLQVNRPPHLGSITGDGDPMTLTVAAGSTECSTAGVQPKVLAERRKRSRARDPGTKHQTTSRPSKRLRTVCCETQHRQPPDESTTMAGTQLVKAPVRRSQKLGDKITALQQLVSPFGKTDTASVLHEAALSINFLHEQIKTLAAPYFGMSSPEVRVQGHARNIADLRSRGLCLAAVDAIPELMDGKACSTCWPEIPVREASLDRHRLSNFTTMHTP
ncbi:hypothetical protein OPV22_004655 [Ensete ventricosum]|uniref:BHLH domain-containing protein n=1 Tax=Ensete ventricosum TaxID=4639 RepID=A0AAV8RJA4_ENSVE|nr:hypothetical protein OPV22_004655 [Ensete ventricosum]